MKFYLRFELIPQWWGPQCHRGTGLSAIPPGDLTVQTTVCGSYKVRSAPACTWKGKGRRATVRLWLLYGLRIFEPQSLLGTSASSQLKSSCSRQEPLFKQRSHS
ncbi:hypothetical protein AGIG_G21095 [Arapaima gigas]